MKGQIVAHTCKRLISSQFQLFWNRNSLHSLPYAQIGCRKHSIHQNYGHRFKSLCANNSLHQKPIWRYLSTTAALDQHDFLLPGNIVRSIYPDRDLPEISFHEYFLARIDQFKDKSAVSDYFTGRTYTYQDLREYAFKVASALSRLGYKKGDVILSFSPNDIQLPVLMLAASLLGVVYTSVNPTFTEDELAKQISDSEAKAVFVHPALTETTKAAIKNKTVSHDIKNLFVFGESDGFQPFQNLLEDNGKALPDVPIDPKEDLFLLPYSSGTTGFPKGVMLTHYNVVVNMQQIFNTMPSFQEDNVLGLLPLYHIYGMVAIQYNSFLGGAHLHLLPRFEPEAFLKCFQEKKISVAHIVPPLILFLAKHPVVSKFDLTNMRTVLSGAAPLGKELSMAFKGRFPDARLVQGFGMTELSPGAILDADEKITSVGRILMNTFAKVSDLETGENLGPNQDGEICIKGPQVMKGYLKNKKATDEMVTPDGWLHTGDIGHFDDEGFFYVSDRLKELIKYKGNQIAPAELEALLLGHEAVQDVAVIGVPDSVAGEVPRAFIVKKPDSSTTEGDIVKYIEERVSPVKKLRGGVKFVNEIPKNPSGKILRRLLKTA